MALHQVRPRFGASHFPSSMLVVPAAATYLDQYLFATQEASYTRLSSVRFPILLHNEFKSSMFNSALSSGLISSQWPALKVKPCPAKRDAGCP